MTPPIGIIGGMGPHAGVDLMRAVLASVRASKDQDYPSIALLSYSDRIPDRSAYLTGQDVPDPTEAILAVAADLGSLGVRWAGLACNTAHAPAIFDRIQARLPEVAPGLTIVNMITEAVAACREVAPGAGRIGVLATLGTYRTRLYRNALASAGLEPVLPSETSRAELVHRAIYDDDFGIKARPDPVTPEARSLLSKAVDELVSNGAEAVILGCTELPLVYPGPHAGPLPAIDATVALARTLVRLTSPERLAPRI